MGRKSSISRLPPELLDQLHEGIRSGQYTIDELVEQLQARGADVKRSAVGRYKKQMQERLGKYRDAQEVARVWVRKFGEQPDSQTGQLLAEMLKSIAFFQLANQDPDEGADPGHIALLARAFKDLSAAQRSDFDYRQRLDAAWRQKLEERTEAAEKAVRKAGVTPEGVARMREILLGDGT